MYKSIILVCFCAVIIPCFVPSIFADCGQVIIYIPKNNSQPEPSLPTPSKDEPKEFVNDNSEYEKEKPKPFSQDSLTSFFDEGRSGKVFEEDVQQAVIAWNGKEEMIVLSTRQQPLVKGEGTVLSIFPMPGKPLSIEKGDSKLFGKTYEKIIQMAKEQHGLTPAEEKDIRTDAITILHDKDIGTHRIIAFQVNDPDTFYADIQKYVSKNFGSGSQAYIGPQQKKVFDYYIKTKGFRYFAIDIQKVTPSLTSKEKEAIAYTFESKDVYFPLVVSQLGGTGKTSIRLIVITPGKVSPTGQVVEQITPSVKMSGSALSSLSAEMGKFMRSSQISSPYNARLWTVNGQLDSFKEDITATVKE